MSTGSGPAEMQRMIQELEALSRGRFMAYATKPLAHEVMARIKTCFTTSQSPYREPWAPVARGGKPLMDRGRLSRAFQDASQPPRIEINNPTIYAAIHNYGGFVVAKNAPYLSFPINGPGTALATRGGKVTKRRPGSKQWVKTKMVYIEARQFLPDDRGLPEDWEERLARIANQVFASKFPNLASSSNGWLSNVDQLLKR
jgi:phage gpG-like protein